MDNLQLKWVACKLKYSHEPLLMKNAIACFALCFLLMSCGNNQSPEVTASEKSKVVVDSSDVNDAAWI
ncbi:MAG TPA: hypothetical protein VK616_12300, partial [Flavitalea sp.]|nr:hypothetical protein [Flavitalea sp.]